MEKCLVRAIRTQQDNDVALYSFFIPGEMIHEIADISRIHRTDEHELEGFQRKEIRRHVDSIVEYLDSESVLFPNSIILAFSDQVKFTQARGKSPKGILPTGDIGTLTIPIRDSGSRVAWIVDGQQRSLALKNAKRNGIPVPVVAFEANDLELQRQQFILVNKAKPLPARLINELLPEVDIRLPSDLAVRKIPSELCNLLNRDPDSPFFELIRRSSTEGSSRAKPVVIDTALMSVIKKSMNNPVGALSQFKGFGRQPSDTDGMYRVMVQYWNVVKSTFPADWGVSPKRSRLMHSAGIQAMGVLMDRVMNRVQYASNPQEELERSLNAIAPHCCWSSGEWPDLGVKWNAIQSISRDIRALSDQLVKLDHQCAQASTQ